LADQEGVLPTCQTASIQYRIALGPRAGHRVRRLGRMEVWEQNKVGDGGLIPGRISAPQSENQTLPTSDVGGSNVQFGVWYQSFKDS